MDASELATCPGCGVNLPAVSGPQHPYMAASPACWALYGELLAAQYSDPARARFHQVVVDTYAVQHPDGDDSRAVQSVAIHLMTLYLFLECGVDPAHGPRLHRVMVDRHVFHHLDPPVFNGVCTHLQVPRDGPASEAREAAYAWARAVWDAWSPHQVTVRSWIAESGLGSWMRGT